jgi:hypothetical protein
MNIGMNIDIDIDAVCYLTSYCPRYYSNIPQDPYILDFLSKSLQAELRLARYHEHLAKLPFLAKLLTNDMQSGSGYNGIYLQYYSIPVII